VPRLVEFVRGELAPRSVNTVILRVDYGYEYASHPAVRSGGALSLNHVKQLAAACRELGIRLIPQINLLGHQSWATRVGKLLEVHPEFDETPWVKMPDTYAWPNPDRLYCKSYCPLHPQVHDVVFALVNELCDAFEADAFHAGMDEVFYLGENRCPRCAGQDKSVLFAGEVKRIRDHLAKRSRALWIWGDRLLDGKLTGLGEWEASLNDTHRAIDQIPKDVVICDWHYERAEPTAVYFAMKGFSVVSCPWKNPGTARRQVEDMFRFRESASPELSRRFLGVVQTVWSGTGSFLDEWGGAQTGGAPLRERSETACFRAVSEAWAAPAPSARR
jgi:hypothetical protein